MPTVVYQQPSTTAGLLAGATGTAQGLVEGAKFNEGQRQFNADLNQKTHQFDADLAFRVDQLKVMQHEGRLDRGQQAALAELERQHQLQLQANGFAQETSEHGLDRAHQSKENELTREVDRFNIRTRKQETDEEVYQRREQAAQQYTLEAKKFSEQGRKLDVMDGIISKYGDPSTWTPQTKEMARKEYKDARFGQGQLTGMKFIPQAPEGDVAAADVEFDSWAIPGALEKQKASYAAQTGAMAAAEASGRQGVVPGNPALGDVNPKDMYGVGASPDPLTGVPHFAKTIEVNGQTVASPLSWYPTDELDDMVADTAVDMAPGFTMDNRAALYEQTLARITTTIDKWDRLSPATRQALKQHYDQALYHALGLVPAKGEEDTAVGE